MNRSARLRVALSLAAFFGTVLVVLGLIGLAQGHGGTVDVLGLGVVILVLILPTAALARRRGRM